MSTSTITEPAGRRRLLALAGVFFATGLVSRIAPLFDQGGRLLAQFPTEDGYLMLTVARNLGIGHGMTIADGTIPTNGIQPFTTFLWALVFGAVDGDKQAGVAGVLGLEIAIGIAAAGLLALVAGRLFAGSSSPSGLAALTAAAWFASVQTTRHAMNGLESGTYVLAVLLFVWALLRLADGAPSRPALGRWAGLGALLGVAFWVRVDAVLLCAALGVMHLGGWLPVWRSRLRERFLELVAAGSACAVVAAPWLIHNFVRFGSVMPVSGQSEGHRVRLGQELPIVPAKLVEYLAVVVQVPNGVELHPATVALCALLLAVAGVLTVRAWPRFGPAARTVGALTAGFALALIAWYGLLFGAGFFMSRYLFPLSPFLAILTFAGAARLGRTAGRPALVAGPLVVLALVAVVGLNLRMYRGGAVHEHAQVVSWVRTHVPEEVWVAAVQTGTLGFFHDRTINLDGKVNPAAMDARRTWPSSVPRYVVESDIQYLVDWDAITRWLDRYPELQAEFEVLVSDPERRLGVLGRRGAPRKPVPPGAQPPDSLL